MPAILEIPEVRERISPLSVEDYHRLSEFNQSGRRTELIRGLVIEKMAKSPLHRILCSRLFKMLLAQLPEGFSVWKEEPLSLADSEPEPDILVARGFEDDFKTSHPSTAELVVEVAVSFPLLDRANASLYAEASVSEYWIVLAEKFEIEVYRNPVNGRYLDVSTAAIPFVIECRCVPGVKVALSELFRS